MMFQPGIVNSMKVERLRNEANLYYCFSIPNILLTRKGAVRIIQKIPEVIIKERPRLFGDDVFCRFTLNGINFTVDEMFGSSDRFDIVAEFPDTEEIEIVALTFEAHKLDYLSLVPWLLMFIGFSCLIFGNIMKRCLGN
jgi:hypothetical protein